MEIVPTPGLNKFKKMEELVQRKSLAEFDNLSEPKDATFSIQLMVYRFMYTVAGYSNLLAHCDDFVAIKYRTQEVPGIGTNYHVKVRVGDNNYIHVRFCQGSNRQFGYDQAIEYDRKYNDPITYVVNNGHN